MRLRLVFSLAVLASACGAPVATAQVAAAPEPELGVTTPAGSCCLIPSGAVVAIELTQPVSSKTAKPGDHFTIKLARDLTVEDHLILAAGATGLGEVVDSAPAGLAGRGGKLVLAARFVESDRAHIPLRSFRLSGAGRDNSKTVAALMMAPYVGVLAFGVQGGNIDYPAGTLALAKVRADMRVEFPSAPTASLTITSPQPTEETP